MQCVKIKLTKGTIVPKEKGQKKMPRRANREEEILKFIHSQIEEVGYPPSIREICAAVGLNSPSTVHAYLKKLEQKGLLEKDGSKTRAIRVVDSTDNTENWGEPVSEFLNVPVLGNVAAGMPILAEENVVETFPLPMVFAKNKNVYMLKVKGESMINAGIMDGDYVIVTQEQTAKNGEMVVALVDDSATVKTFYKENGHFRLQPENDEMAPIIVEELQILGKVSGVFRIY